MASTANLYQSSRLYSVAEQFNYTAKIKPEQRAVLTFLRKNADKDLRERCFIRKKSLVQEGCLEKEILRCEGSCRRVIVKMTGSMNVILMALACSAASSMVIIILQQQ